MKATDRQVRIPLKALSDSGAKLQHAEFPEREQRSGLNGGISQLPAAKPDRKRSGVKRGRITLNVDQRSSTWPSTSSGQPAREDVEPRLFVLASYAAGEDPSEVAGRYMQSTEFADDIRNFNVSDIVGVESTILIPSTSSPLK